MKRKKKRDSRRIGRWTLLCCEWEQIDRRAMRIGGLFMVGVVLLCALAVGSPLYARHMLILPGCMPPSWCMFVLSTVLYFLLGALIGALVAAPSPVHLRARYHGMLFLVAYALFRLFWYPLFFGVIAPAIALIALLLSAALCICALIHLWRVFFLAVPILLLELIYGLWLCWANLLVLLLN